MNANNLLIQLWLLLICTINVHGQVYVKDKPYSFKHQISMRIVQKKVLPNIDTLKLSMEDRNEAQKQIPPRFGYTFSVNFNLLNSGTWSVLEDGSRLWELVIECQNALSVNLLYDKFWLPDSAKFFIYNESKTQIIGAFTSNNNSGTKEKPDAFATGLVYGSKINLEYYEPKEQTGQGIISIVGVVHGYRYIKVPGKKYNKDYGDSGSCNININCNQGEDWQMEKRGVALIVVDGNRYCTGCLVNNTDQDATPYLLTANHCLAGWANPNPLDAINNPNANTWTFIWNYESPGCTNQDIINPTTTARATVVANNSNSDFALLRLTESPNDLNVYYCGWDRSGTTPNSSVCIHHPSGDIKKITFDNDSPQVTGYSDTECNAPTGTTHWRIIDWDNGTTEGGSSGSPLFNPSHRIIGQLHGGCAACNNNLSDYFGRFSISWNSSNDSRRRLMDWLDSSNNVNILSGLRFIQNATINSNTPVNGDNVKFENVSVQTGSVINIDINDSFSAFGTFNAPVGTTLSITY